MNPDDIETLKLETIGVLIDAYYTDAGIAAVLAVDINKVKQYRQDYYSAWMKYAA
jgi:hypothetical protein